MDMIAPNLTRTFANLFHKALLHSNVRRRPRVGHGFTDSQEDVNDQIVGDHIRCQNACQPQKIAPAIVKLLNASSKRSDNAPLVAVRELRTQLRGGLERFWTRIFQPSQELCVGLFSP